MPPRKAKRANQAKALRPPSPLMVEFQADDDHDIENQDTSQIDTMMSKDGAIVALDPKGSSVSYIFYPDSIQIQQNYLQETTLFIGGQSFTRSGDFPRNISNVATEFCADKKGLAKRYEAPETESESDKDETDEGTNHPARWKEFLKDNSARHLPVQPITRTKGISAKPTQTGATLISYALESSNSAQTEKSKDQEPDPKDITQPAAESTSKQNPDSSKPKKATPFQPRRHPATLNLGPPASTQVTCLLLSPAAETTLQSIPKPTLAKALSQLNPQPVALRPIRGGGFAADFPADCNLEHLLQLTEIGSVPIKVRPPKAKPDQTGIVQGQFARAEEVRDLYVIHEENPEITEITQIGSSKSFKIVFTSKRPRTVKLFFNTVSVIPYYITPTRCYQCSKFGHKARDCKSEPKCSICASNAHAHQDCPKTSKLCINCGGPHEAIYKKFPHRLYLISVAKAAAVQNLHIQEAKKQEAVSYAKALAKNLTPVSPTSMLKDTNPPEALLKIQELLTLNFPDYIIVNRSNNVQRNQRT